MKWAKNKTSYQWTPKNFRTFWVPKILWQTIGLLDSQKPHIYCTSSCAHHSPPTPHQPHNNITTRVLQKKTKQKLNQILFFTMTKMKLNPRNSVQIQKGNHLSDQNRFCLLEAGPELFVLRSKLLTVPTPVVKTKNPSIEKTQNSIPKLSLDLNGIFLNSQKR